MVREQVEYRELLWAMTLRDLRLRYKQTIMGFGWAVFMPLINTLVFSVIFTRIAPLKTPVPYPVFAFCSFWVWNFFASALRFAVPSLTNNSVLVSKIYFPREIFPFSSILVCLVDFLIGAVILAAFMAWYRVTPGFNLVWLPLLLSVQLMFTMAVGLSVSMANLFYRDVKYLFEVVITVWMFATPVVYPLATVDGRLASLIRLNPMTPIVEGYRNVILLNVAPPNLFGVAAVSLVTLALAWAIFHRSEFVFAERI